MFIVGVAMPFSYAIRRGAGASWWKLALHAFIRSLVLVLLGVLLYSKDYPNTHWIFKNVLAQIGLGYFFVFLLLELRWFWQLLAAFAILALTWFAFDRYPILTPEEISAKGIEGRWEYYRDDAAHWNKNTNFAAEADRVFLNLFPRKKFVGKEIEPNRYKFDDGYQTLNFVPSMGTMLFGVVAGVLLRSALGAAAKFSILLVWGLAFLAGGAALDHTILPSGVSHIAINPKDPAQQVPTIDAGFHRPFADKTWTVCPIVKKIWTPTWTIFSTGWTLILLAVFFGVIDGLGWRLWAFPFIVVGLNSITIYLLANTVGGWIKENVARHTNWEWLNKLLGSRLLEGPYEPMKSRIAVMLVLWLFCYWLYRQRVYLKI
jgi:predicted acyltransferase